MPTPTEQLLTIRDGYLAALAADAANPVPSHNIDGIQVSATEWRKELLERIAQINTLLNAFNPQELRSMIL
jgi:hypothetical protein